MSCDLSSEIKLDISISIIVLALTWSTALLFLITDSLHNLLQYFYLTMKQFLLRYIEDENIQLEIIICLLTLVLAYNNGSSPQYSFSTLTDKQD